MMQTVFSNRFLDDPLVRRIVLKTAISSNAFDSYGIRFRADYFGQPQMDIHAYIAKFAEFYTERNEVPGFDIIRAHIESEPVDTTEFTLEDVLHELDEIYRVDASAFDSIAEGFANFIRDWVAYNAIREAYATVSAPGRKKIEDVKAVLDRAHENIDSVEQAAKGDFIENLPDDPPGVSVLYKFGLRDLDMRTDGIRTGEFFLFLGAPKGRKTSFLTSAAAGLVVSDPKVRVLFVSFEMTIEAMRDRFTSTLSTMAIARGYSGSGQRGDIARFLGVDKRLYLLYEPPGSTTASVYKAIKRLSARGFVPDVVFLDYMIFMQPMSKKSEKRHELAEIARDCVRLAKRAKVGVVSAHLLKRDALKNPKQISKIDIAESYEVIAVVDAAIAICPPDSEEQQSVGNYYRLRIVAGRRFEDEVDAGIYKPAYDGVTMECV